MIVKLCYNFFKGVVKLKKQLPKRLELDVKHTWDITNLFKNEELYQKAFEIVEKDVDLFCEKFENKLKSNEQINDALTTFQDIQASLSKIGAFSSLQMSTDSISEDNQIRNGKAMIRIQSISKKMAFFLNELKQTSDEMLFEASKLNKNNQYFLKEIIEKKKYALKPEVEKALVDLSPVLNAFYMNYNRFKLADMKFADFLVHDTTYPNSFTLFENEYEYEENTWVRRSAYEAFYQKLANTSMDLQITIKRM